MTSYKICLTVLVFAGLSATANCLYNPSNHQRIRRANTEDERPSGPASDTTDDHGYEGGYRFGDEYFLPEASKSVPTEYIGKTNGCERVTKDSMVCMVCKDPKTNEKYEQCSYVAQPNTKAFTESRSFDNPEKTKKSTKKNEESDSPEFSGESYESSETPHKIYEKYESSEPTYNYKAESHLPYRYSESSDEESKSFRDPAESSDCRKVKKDGATCTICKDPDTGRDVEKCSSSYQPDEKAFSTGKSEKYSYPKSQEDKKEYNSYNDDSSSESSEDPAESSNCRQVQKDGQTCSICKDPKTGSDLERCSSSYQPDDKSYAYGRSERYGYPHSHDNYDSPNDGDKSAEISGSYESSPSEFRIGYLKANDDNYRKYHEGEPEEIRESNYDDRKHPSYEESSTEYAALTAAAQTKKSSNTGEGTDCREVRKDSMTCTVCTDPKTGGNFQKCSYAYKPNDKVYKFTNSKTFGYPENQNQKGSKENSHISQRAAGSSNYPRESETKQVPEAVKANPCRKVQRDSKTCTVCEDPITGESSEQCAYSYKPKKKHFAWVNSRSIGNPQKGEKKRGSGSIDEGQQESRQVPRFSNEEKLARSEKKSVTANTGPCKQILKDSMTCIVCKDPKTGASSEQCAYSSEPKEKLFTYSKSSSFPKIPQRDEKEGRNTSNSEKGRTDQGAESVETNPCKQVIKDSMTCTICKDPNTGENSEQCAYGSEPKKRHFTYSKSKSFGNPRKRGGEPQESQQIARKLDNGHHDFLSSNRPDGFSKPEWDFHL